MWNIVKKNVFAYDISFNTTYAFRLFTSTLQKLNCSINSELMVSQDLMLLRSRNIDQISHCKKKVFA